MDQSEKDDSAPSSKTTIDWAKLKAKLRDALLTLPQFLKNPIEGMKHLPPWDWTETLILQSALAAICGVLKSLVERNYLGSIFSIFLGPLSALLLSFIFTGFFFYFFYFFMKREIPFQRLYLHIVFSSIPVLITSTVSYHLPPISLIGVMAAALLLYVGLNEEFRLARERLKKILGTMVVIYLMIWIWQLIQVTHRQESFRQQATPESMEILEKDFKQTE